MPAEVISIAERRRAERRGCWSLLEMAKPGRNPVPLGIFFADAETDKLILRLRDLSELPDLEEQEADILDFLSGDLHAKAAEAGAASLLSSLEGSLSHFLRIGDRTSLSFTGDAARTADRLFDEYVDDRVQPFVTHLPLYGLRAAATKFGESMDSELEGWLRAPADLRLTPDMFVARVVGRSMEPLIQDGSLCVFRAGVTGSRQGRRLLIEHFSETDFASRYTVKRYTSKKKFHGSDFGENEREWEHEQIRLEPLNRAFAAFDLGPDEFRVIAEFVEVLDD